MKKFLVLMLSLVLFVSSFGAKKLYVGTNAALNLQKLQLQKRLTRE